MGGAGTSLRSSQDLGDDAAPDGGPTTPERRVRPGHLAVVAGLALLVGLVVLRPWPLDQPVVYRGDIFQQLAMVQAADDIGTPGHSADLAAPDGVDWASFPTGTERAQLATLRALDAVTGDVFAALNLYLLIGLVGTAVAAFAVLGWLRVDPVIAGGAAMVYALSPAFGNAVFEGHLFLFALFPVPLGIYLALWASERRGLRDLPRGRAALLPVGAGLLVAVSSAYYATFSLIVIAGLGLLVAARRRDWRRLVVPALTSVSIAVVSVVSLAPQLVARIGDPTSSAIERTVDDARRYALHPQELLVLRADHPLAPLASLSRWLVPGGQQDHLGTFFGLVALAGLAWTVVVGLRRCLSPRDRTDRSVARLTAVIAISAAFAVSGGLGLVVAELGFTQIRAWTRMTTFLAFASLAGLSLLAQRSLGPARMSRPARNRVVVVVALFALLDQGLTVPPHDLTGQVFRSDAALVRQMQERLGRGATVFQLPVVSFPDDPGSERLLAPALFASGLRFSAGFFRGGVDDWQMSWCHQPTEPLVRGIAAAGFDAVLVEGTHHLVDDDAGLEAELRATLGPPAGTSRDGAFTWYDLRPLRRSLDAGHDETAVDRAGGLVRRPIGVSYQGTTVLTTLGRVMDHGGAVTLQRLDGDRSPVRLQMSVYAPAGSEVRVRGRTFAVGADRRAVVDTEVSLRSSTVSVPVQLEGGGGVTVADVTVLDTSAPTDPVLRADPTPRPATLGCR